MLRGLRMCRSSVLRNNYFCVFLIAKIARMNCFHALFSFQTCTDRDGYGIADTIFCRRKATPEHPTKKPWTKYSRTYLRTMRFNSRIRLLLFYWHVWEYRMHALLKDKHPSFSLSVSAHLTAIVCVFLGLVWVSSSTIMLMFHTRQVWLHLTERTWEKKEGCLGSFANAIKLYHS